MGNSLGCSVSCEWLMSVAHDGNAVEAWILLELDPSLALRYYTFDGLNAPLHFAAARGHVDIVTLLLETGADVNMRNYCGQVDLCDFSLSYTSLIFVRLPSSKAPAFRFLPSKVSEMEACLQQLNNIPSRAVLQSLTDKFSASPERTGRVAIQPCQGGDPLLGLQSTVAGVAKTPPPRMVAGSLPSRRGRDHLRISSALDWHSLGVVAAWICSNESVGGNGLVCEPVI